MNNKTQTHDAPKTWHQSGGYVAHDLLGMPLAISTLLVYIQITVYYATQLGLSLATTGWVLFLALLVYAFQDFLLGQWNDKLHRSMHRLQNWIGSGFFGLWLPPVASTHLTLWLTC